MIFKVSVRWEKWNLAKYQEWLAYSRIDYFSLVNKEKICPQIVGKGRIKYTMTNLKAEAKA